MRKELLISIVLLFAISTTNVLAQTTKDNFIVAKQQLENMLSGKDSLSYEKAIYIIEHAYNNDKTTYQDFQQVISFYTEMIEQVVKKQNIQPEYKPENFYQKVRQLSDEYNRDFMKARNNFGIFTFMTDTTFFRLDSNFIMYNMPYGYSTADPMGTSDWHNTQVINILENGKGNCFALSSLFKIFADRLHSDATLCTAPNHIYIRHLDEKGTRYNVDLSSGTFPGAGTLQTLTYTTKEALKNDISLRKLTTQQAVALCVVYLAKGYQYKFDVKDDFMVQCAETALKYDSLNLNAMLLKAEYLEHILKQQNKTITQLQTSTKFKEYEKLLSHLYTLGYREMPLDMKNILVHGWKKDTTMLYLQNHELVKKGETRKWTLSNGLFDEEHAYKPIEQYSQTLFNCKTKKIQGFAKEKPLYNDYNFDPVAFAMNVDPLAHKYAGQTPYTFASNSPIAGIDKDGLEFYFAADGTFLGKYGESTEIRVIPSWNVANAMKVLTNKPSGDYDIMQRISLFSYDLSSASLEEATRIYRTIYDREVKGESTLHIYAGTEDKSQPANASTDPKTRKITVYKDQKYVNDKTGGIDYLMRNYYDVAVTLEHEDNHFKGMGSDAISHFLIGLKEMCSKNWKNTTKNDKDNTINNMKNYLVAASDNSFEGWLLNNKNDKDYANQVNAFFFLIDVYNKVSNEQEKLTPQSSELKKQYLDRKQ